MKQHYAVGQYLRKRYIEGNPYRLLNTAYCHNEVCYVNGIIIYLLTYEIAVHTLVNGVITHQKQKISKM